MFLQCSLFLGQKGTLVWWYLVVSDRMWLCSGMWLSLYIYNVPFLKNYLTTFWNLTKEGEFCVTQNFFRFVPSLFALWKQGSNSAKSGTLEHSLLFNNLQTYVTEQYRNITVQTTKYHQIPPFDITRYMWDNISCRWGDPHQQPECYNTL